MNPRSETNRCLFCGGDGTGPNHTWVCDGRQGRVEAERPHEPDLRGMVHRDDPHTSVEAAVTIEVHRTELHERVLDAFVKYGPMTDAELEELPEFQHYGPSTIRKRRSELFQQQQLVAIGERRNARNCRMLVWGLPTSETMNALSG